MSSLALAATPVGLRWVFQTFYFNPI